MSLNSFSDRTVLITGGAGGVGIEAARALHARGAHVIIGSRDSSHYEAVAEELGEARVDSFIADIRDESSVSRELQRLERRGLQPTDVVHSAAGGMEPFLRDLTRVMTGLRRLQGAELDAAHAAAVAELTPLVEASLEHALNVNFVAPSRLLDRIAPGLPRGGTVTFYSTYWATFHPHPQTPIYYRSVAQSKHELERWLAARAGEWHRNGVTTGVISTSLIINTRMGYLLDRFCAELMPASDRERWRATFVSSTELVEETIKLMDGRRKGDSTGFAPIFITRPGHVVDHMTADDPQLQIPMALAPNAPRWADEEVTRAR